MKKEYEFSHNCSGILHSFRMRHRTGTTPILSPQAAVAFIESSDRVFVHSLAMAPPTLIEALSAREDLAGVELIHIHTEMFSDGLIPLVEGGVVTGEEKLVMPLKIVATYALGSERLYRFIDDNPMVIFEEAAFTNDSAIIRQNPKVTAVNSALEIDLTGQVCADSIGPFQNSGVGGQMDFIRGASLSPGKPIIAMPSTTRSGRSKISTYLQPGASVTTTRAHVHYVVTEYGVAPLRAQPA